MRDRVCGSRPLEIYVARARSLAERYSSEHVMAGRFTHFLERPQQERYKVHNKNNPALPPKMPSFAENAGNWALAAHAELLAFSLTWLPNYGLRLLSTCRSGEQRYRY